jgi:predicted porin
MKKTLVALAAIAATSAFAQSTVTISGFGNLSYDLFSISQGKAASARTSNTSEDRVTDNSGRIIFNSNEDLGGGMRAFWQVDLRPLMDSTARVSAICATPAVPAFNSSGVATTTAAIAVVASETCTPGLNPLSGGNSHIGLSGSLGAVRFGRQDIHYTEGGNFAPVSNPTIQSHAGLLVTAAHGQAVGRASRTGNLIWYTSPTVNGFGGTLGYSTNGYSESGTADVENDLASAQRKGSTQYARLGYAQGPLTAVVSWISEKSDYIGTAATYPGVTASIADYANNFAQADLSGSIVSVKYDLGMVKLGAAVANNRSQVNATGTLAATASKRTNTQFGVGVPMGASNVALTYTKVGNVSLGGSESANTGASSVALAYSYDLSKRTQLFAGMQQINNKSLAQHGLFYGGDNVVGSIGSGAAAGETLSVTSFGMRHSF